jgi:hypothetical protein
MKIVLHRYRTTILSPLANLSSYLDRIEAQIQDLHPIERFNKSEEFKFPSGISQAEYQDLYAEHQDQLHQLDHEFTIVYPRLLRYSFVIILHSLVETGLRSLCNVIVCKKQELGLQMISPQDGRCFERAKDILCAASLSSIVYGPQWASLTDLQKVRNCIVHHGGRVADTRDTKRLGHLVKQGIGLSIQTGGHFLVLPEDESLLIVERPFCAKMLDSARTFFVNVFDQSGCIRADGVEIVGF